MVVIKPTRDFTSLSRISYTASNGSKERKGSVTNRYRQESKQGRLLPQPGKAASTNLEYKENQCAALGSGIGARHHQECPFAVMADQYASTGSEALETAISAAYKQVYGNLGPTESQRSVELESRLRNGDISVRDFVACLAKSDLYKQSYFFRTSPIRGIELNLKHLLGRPPISQAEVSACISLIAEQGYDALVDKITHSGEYLEVFGTDTVPYPRAWTSEAGFDCSTFVNHSQVTQGNAASDTITERRSQLVVALNNARNISTKKGFDVSGFVYSKAVQDPTSGAFKRMFNPKNSKSWV